MKAVRDEYAKIGVKNYYLIHSKDYSNPHEATIIKLLTIAEKMNYIGKKVLDLCCGSGEVTSCLEKYDHEITGLDPYTTEAYYNRTKKTALKLSFKDIVNGFLKERFDCIISSFAMHLCDESMLPSLLWKLCEISNTLIVITPHKRPDCDNVSCWILVDEIVLDRVRMRIYLNKNT